MIDESGGKDVYLDNLISEFGASTNSGEKFMTFLRMRNKSFLKVQFLGEH